MEWISVKDRLPEPNTPVLIYGSISGGTCCTKPCVREGMYDEEQKSFVIGEFECFCETTHWRLFPEPPTKD